jgi:PhnB protein
MQITPYLFFPGTCRAAMTRYAEILQVAPPEIMTFADMPEEARAEMPGIPDEAVMHAELSHGTLRLMGSDEGTAEEGPMARCSVTLTLPSAAEAERVFAALAEGGTVRMPLAPTFWTPAFGTLSDRWGTRWMVMADVPEA